MRRIIWPYGESHSVSRRTLNVDPEAKVKIARDKGDAPLEYESIRRTRSGSSPSVKRSSARYVSSFQAPMKRTNVPVARNRTCAFCPCLRGQATAAVTEIPMTAAMDTVRAIELGIIQRPLSHLKRSDELKPTLSRQYLNESPELVR